MRNLFLIAIVAMAIQAKGQQLETVNESLAQRTGENTSLYDAVCELNDIVPGSIGMKAGRVLMAEYAEMIGLNYKLYLLNGGNNIHILHYVTAWEVMQKDTSLSNDITCASCRINHDAQDRTIGIDPNADASLYFEEEEMVDTVVIIEVIVDTVILTKTITETVIDTVENDYCNCTDLTLDQAWVKYKGLKDSWKEDVRNHNGIINSGCQTKLRKYIWSLQRNEINVTRWERKNKMSNESPLVIPSIGVVTVCVTDTKSKVKRVTNKKRARKLGKGHAKGGGLWSKLFPFANC